MKLAPVVDGPVEKRAYCPWWASYLWRAREMKGAVKVWELWDGEYYPGLGRVISEFANALAGAEYEAQRQYQDWSRRR
jgi:hypothetical protein